MNKNSKVVFSTDPSYQEESDVERTLIKNQEQQLGVWRQRLGGDRMVTIVKGFIGPEADLKSLGKTLRSHCSSGGSVKKGEILIQGDHRDKIVNFLNSEGYKSKASGG